jgi:hypothetical protein
MEIKKILRENKNIVENRKITKRFINPIYKLKDSWKPMRASLSKENNKKENPIVNLVWYKNIVEELYKHPNIINSNDKFYRFGVYIKFNGLLSVKYSPYVVKVSNFKDKPIKAKEELLENVFKNLGRCFYCDKSINLKIEEEYEYEDNKLMCAWCYSVPEVK